MIIQISQSGISARLELLGIELDDNEHTIVKCILEWIVGFLLGCSSLKKLGAENASDIYKTFVVESMTKTIAQSTAVLKELSNESDSGTP